MGTLTEKKTKTVYLEAIRIVAIYLVIFNHTEENGFFLFSYCDADGVLFWGYLVLSVFCVCAVPLFLAVSGALMLNKDEESLTILWRKRISKYVGILCICFLCSYLIDSFVFKEPINWTQLFVSLYAGRFEGGYFWDWHLWYLYAYISYLICLPFLRTLVQNLKTKYFYYWIGITLFFSTLLPALEYLASQGKITLYGDLKPGWLLGRVILYPAIGYFLECRATLDKEKGNLLWLWFLNGAGIAATCCMVYYEGKMNGVYSETFHSLFTLLNCIAIYVTIKYIFTHFRIPQWLEKGILSVGECTFGIYLIHVIVLYSAPMKKLLEFMTKHGINSMVAGIVQCMAVMAVCYGITRILLKIPYIKKLVGG